MARLLTGDQNTSAMPREGLPNYVPLRIENFLSPCTMLVPIPIPIPVPILVPIPIPLRPFVKPSNAELEARLIYKQLFDVTWTNHVTSLRIRKSDSSVVRQQDIESSSNSVTSSSDLAETALDLTITRKSSPPMSLYSPAFEGCNVTDHLAKDRSERQANVPLTNLREFGFPVMPLYSRRRSRILDVPSVRSDTQPLSLESKTTKSCSTRGALARNKSIAPLRNRIKWTFALLHYNLQKRNYIRMFRTVVNGWWQSWYWKCNYIQWSNFTRRAYPEVWVYVPIGPLLTIHQSLIDPVRLQIRAPPCSGRTSAWVGDLLFS